MKKRLIVFIIIITLVLSLTPSTLAIVLENLEDATYLVGETPTSLSVGPVIYGTTCQWQEKITIFGTDLWIDIEGETALSFAPPTDSAGTRTYRCAKTNFGTITYTSEAAITVLEAPEISVTPATQNVALSGTATFTAAISGTDGWTLTKSYWAWGPTDNPADIEGDTGTAVAPTTYSTTLTASGTTYYFYVCEYTDETNGTKDITVYSNGAEAIVSSFITLGNLNDATYLIGETATPLSIGMVLYGTTYQWQYKAYLYGNPFWIDITGATNGAYTPPTSETSTKTYRCAMTYDGSITYTDEIIITVLESPAISVAPASQSIESGEGATFMTTVTGTDGWTLTKSYWAWGPTSHSADIEGDYSESSTFATLYYNPTLTTAGTVYYFYVGEYTDDANGTKDITVYSKGAEVIVSEPETPETPINPFTDVSSSDWFYDEVLYAYGLGLVNGMTATTYAPDSHLTIAQAIKLAACMHQYYNDGSVTLVNGTVNWYDTYVDYAAGQGIISLSTYAGRYNDNATRADYVEIFYYALPASEYTVIHGIPDGLIPDVAITASYGFEVYAFYRAGILQGNDSVGTFAPDSSIKRSEVAAIIARMMDPANRLTAAYAWEAP